MTWTKGTPKTPGIYLRYIPGSSRLTRQDFMMVGGKPTERNAR